MQLEPRTRLGDRRWKLGRCPRCTGNLFLETDVVERLILRKCLQCGGIESYFWLERSSNTLVYLPPEDELPPENASLADR